MGDIVDIVGVLAECQFNSIQFVISFLELEHFYKQYIVEPRKYNNKTTITITITTL